MTEVRGQMTEAFDCGPPWRDLLGTDSCLGNIPEGQRIVLHYRVRSVWARDFGFKVSCLFY
jgi:hypothetical protein